jgi:hypothetical protein
VLDEHIAPDVADILTKDGVEAVSMQEWHGGQFFSQPDHQILLAAAAENRTLATYDVHSIPVALRHLAEAGADHGGLVFVSDKSVSQDDIAGIARGLLRLSRDYHDIPLRNCVLFLPGLTR